MKLYCARFAYLVIVLLIPRFATASLSIVLGWDPSPDSEVVGYRLHIGEKPSVYTRVLDVGPSTQAVADALQWDTSYYFAVSAYDAKSLESELSEPIAYHTPQAPVVVIDPPVIQEEPTGQLVVKGEGTALTAIWTGGSPLICQWYKNDLPLADGPSYSGVNSARLSILGADESSEGVYSVILSNPSGSTRSKPAYVHVLIEPKVESVVSLGNGTSRVTIANHDGSSLTPSQVLRVTVLTSTNPAANAAWTPLTNAMSLSDGNLTVQDVQVLNYPQRYYRALVTGSSTGPLQVEAPQRMTDGAVRIGVKRADQIRSITPAEAMQVRLQASADPFGFTGWETLPYNIQYGADRLVLEDPSASSINHKFYRSMIFGQQPSLRLAPPFITDHGTVEVAVTRTDGLPLRTQDVFNYEVFVKTNLLSHSPWTLLSHPMAYSNGVITIDDTNSNASLLRAYRVFAK